jgi:ATP-binding cassette subfamily F protein 3
MKKDSKDKKRATDEEIKCYIRANEVRPPPNPALTRTHFNFEPINLDSTRNIISLNGVSFGYDEKKPTSIFKNLDCGISLQSRIVLVGPNGSGKSTFFKLIAGTLQPTSGEIVRDGRTRVAIYSQNIIDSLDLTLTPLEFLQQRFNLQQSDCRKHLGQIGLKKIEKFDPCTNLISQLSGGFKARLAFLLVILAKPSVILLDEPTNHLDAETTEFLIDALNDYSGGLVVITHSIDFIKGINDHEVWSLSGRNIHRYDEIDTYAESVIARSKF